MNGVDPVVRLMLLCDDVERPVDAPSKVNIIGLVHAITVSDEAEFPIIHQQLTVYLLLAGARGSARVQIVGIDADTEEICFQNPERTVDFGTDPLLVTGMTFRIRDVRFTHPGLHLIQFRCNGKVLAHHPLLVR